MRWLRVLSAGLIGRFGGRRVVASASLRTDGQFPQPTWMGEKQDELYGGAFALLKRNAKGIR